MNKMMNSNVVVRIIINNVRVHYEDIVEYNIKEDDLTHVLNLIKISLDINEKGAERLKFIYIAVAAWKINNGYLINDISPCLKAGVS